MSSTDAAKVDAFISYHHDDNLLGWVDNFHKGLFGLLAGMLPKQPKIWRDPNMPGYGPIAGHLHEKLEQATILISILSPGYLNSDWCMAEMKEFCRVCKERDGLDLASHPYVFKIFKTFIEREQYPGLLQGEKGYEFFEFEPMSIKPSEFDSELGPNKDKRFWARLSDLAWDIKEVLGKLKPARPPSPSIGEQVFAKPPAAAKGAVYLAETTYDLKDTRDKIKRELQEHGYEILPGRELPLVSPDYEEAVRGNLENCKLSVHLIGETYGIVPERARNRSIVLLQNQIAAEYSNSRPHFSRLIWMPKDLQPAEEQQAQFIAELKSKAEYQRGAELLLTPLDELNTIIQKRLTSSNGHKRRERLVRKRIYLICDSLDGDDIVPLNDHLIGRDYEVMLPLLDGGEDDQGIELHKNKLLQCDALLIYYGKAGQRWLEQKQLDLEKITGLERNAAPDRVKPLLATLIYVAGPPTNHKRLFNSFDPPTKKNFGGFSPTDLDKFLTQIETAEEGD